VLCASRFTHPLRVQDIGPTLDGVAYAMLLNPAGGLVGGDRLSTTIVLEPGAHACCTTASATKVYRTLGQAAVCETKTRLAREAILEYVPDHVIPHAGAFLRQSLEVEMEERSRAIIAESYATGRIARGERLQFKEVDSSTRVTVCGKEIFFSRSRLTPQTIDLDAPGRLEGFNYLGTLLIVAEDRKKQDWQCLCDGIERHLSAYAQVRGGTSILAYGGCVARFLTSTAHELAQLTYDLWMLARRELLGLAEFNPRKY